MNFRNLGLQFLIFNLLSMTPNFTFGHAYIFKTLKLKKICTYGFEPYIMYEHLKLLDKYSEQELQKM